MTAPGDMAVPTFNPTLVASFGDTVSMPVYSTTPIEQNCDVDGVTVNVVEPPARLTDLEIPHEPFASLLTTADTQVLAGIELAVNAAEFVLELMHATA